RKNMMRAWMWGGTALALFAGLTRAAESFPCEMTVVVPEVEARCQPGYGVYATSKLHRGDRFCVLREEPGGLWLAIAPPRGSFSWIKASAIQRLAGACAVVGRDGARVRVGSSLTNKTPDVEQVTLPPGTQVIILGEPALDGADKWWPIRPPPSEVRFIPKSAVGELPASVQNKIPSSVELSAPAGALSGHSLWEQAERAEKSGNIDEAIRRYEELGRQTASTDHALSIRAFSQAQCLREGNHGSVPPNYQRGNPTDVYYGSSTSASRPATIPIHPVS